MIDQVARKSGSTRIEILAKEMVVRQSLMKTMKQLIELFQNTMVRLSIVTCVTDIVNDYAVI
jgi:hypothetical protein